MSSFGTWIRGAVVAKVVKQLPKGLSGPLGVATSGWSFFETVVHEAASASARQQAIEKSSYSFERLEALCTQSSQKGDYLSDYMYFTLDGYDGAFKIFREMGGSLYLIRENGGGSYLVWGKTLIITEQGFKILAQMRKSGSAIQEKDVGEFLKVFLTEVAERQRRINLMQGHPRFGQQMMPM